MVGLISRQNSTSSDVSEQTSMNWSMFVGSNHGARVPVTLIERPPSGLPTFTAAEMEEVHRTARMMSKIPAHDPEIVRSTSFRL